MYYINDSAARIMRNFLNRPFRYYISNLLILIAMAWLWPGAPGLVDDLKVALAASDPVIATAGDIACDPGESNFNGGNGTLTLCRQKYTSDLLVNGGYSAVLALGDNQYYCGGYQAFLQSYDLSWGRVKSITRPVVGNHEYLTSGGTDCTTANAGAAGYFQYFGAAAGNPSQGYYSYDIGAWHLIALNSNCGDAGGCSSSTPQGQWLAADLAAHANICTLAYWHIPLFSSGGRASPNTQSIWQTLYNANADVILTGHDHIYERFAPQTPAGAPDNIRGIRQFIVGSGGANHTSLAAIAANSEVRNDNTYGILKLTLHPTSYDWQFIPEVGQTFTDSGSTPCHGLTSDVTAPTTPGDLVATAVAPNQVNLGWTASTDNVGVVGYQVFRNNVQIATAYINSFSDTTVQPQTTYTYKVIAFDAGGNFSAASNNASATTPPPAPTVISSVRLTTDPNLINVKFTVTFSRNVTGVDASDFGLTTTGVSGVAVSGVSGSGSTYTVTVNTGTGNGTIRLDVVDNDSIKDGSNTPLGGIGAGNGNFTSGEIYTIIKTVIISGNAAVNGATLSYTDKTLKTVTANASGNYSITVSYAWSGKVTPSLADTTFTPASRTYTNVTTNQTAQNYTAQRLFSDISIWTTAFDLAHGWTVADYVRTVGDVNGDGKADLVGFGKDGVYTALSTGSGFSVISRRTTAFDLAHGWTVADYVRTVGDVNGDGKADLIGFGKDGVYVALSTGSGFSAISRWTKAFDLAHGWTVKDFVRTVGDVNGDGKADLVGFGQDGVYVALSTGSKFSAVSRWTNAFDLAHGWTVKDYVRTVGDVNGDGKADLVGFGLDGVYVALSTGSKFSAVSRWTTAFDLAHGWTVKDYVRAVGDINGDGKADLVGFGLDGVYAALSVGNTFSPPSLLTTSFDLADGWTVAQYVRTVGDVTGNGKDDLVGFGQSGVYVMK